MPGCGSEHASTSMHSNRICQAEMNETIDIFGPVDSYYTLWIVWLVNATVMIARWRSNV